MTMDKIPSLALIKRETELRMAQAEFQTQLDTMLEGAPTVDLCRALARDAETSFRHYTEAFIRLQEAK